MKAITTILLTVCFFIITFSQPNQNNIFLVKIESKDYKSLVKLDYSSGKETIIYNVQDYDYLIDASISPNGKYISIIEKKKGEIVLNEERNVGEYGKLPTQNMVIINVHGDVVMDLNKDVRRYVWNKKGDKIAFITGTYMEDAEYGFAPESVYIYDIIQDNLIQVQVNNAYKIHWLNTNNENALYLLCPARNPEEFVVKYDIDKKKVMTSLGVKSIHFSPDGKYYYSTPIETSNNGECNGGETKHYTCWRIFETKTNQLIKEFSSNSMGRAVGWVYNQGHWFMFTKQEKLKKERTYKNKKGETVTGTFTVGIKKSENFVYDVEKKQLIQQFNGNPTITRKWGVWIGNGNYIVLEKVGEKETEKKQKEIIIQNIPAENLKE